MTSICSRILLATLAASTFAACNDDVCEDKGDICTWAGTGIAGFSGDGEAAIDADLYLPMDVVFGPDQIGYVVDWNNHRIRSVDGEGVIRTEAGTGELGDDTGVELESSFNHPTSAIFDGQGRMLIAAWHNSRLKRLDLKTKQVENICGTGKRTYGGDEGPADKADLDLPSALALDPNGNLFVLDQANQVIRKIDAANNITRYAGKCVIGTCAEGETAKLCPAKGKYACGVDTAFTENCAKVCPGGFGGDNGPALDARISMPVGQAADPGGRMAIDTQGVLFFADTKNHRIRRIGTDGVITTIAGNGSPGTSPNGTLAKDALINKPIDVELGPDGLLYFADTGNSCVRRITAAGAVETVAGKCGEKGMAGNGEAATSALLNHPYGIAFDSAGQLYVADTENSRVRKVLLK